MEVIFNIRFRAQEVIWGCVHWTETNLAMQLKPHDTVFLTMTRILSCTFDLLKPITG